MRWEDIKPIVREILFLPAHLIWLSWRISGGSGEEQSFVQVWKDTKDEFYTELSHGARPMFAGIGSIGIYIILFVRLLTK